MKKVSVEISHKTIILTLALLILAWLLYQIRDIVFAFFIALILMGALNPTVTRLEKRKVPRWLAITSIYGGLLIIVISALAGLIPPLVQQVGDLVRTFPDIIGRISFFSLPPEIISGQINNLLALPSGVLRLAVSFFSHAFSLLAVLVITFYLLLEHKNLDQYLFDLFGEAGKEKGRRIIRRLERTLGGWVRAEVILMTFVGTLSYFGFLVLGLDFALPLALLAGLLEIVPNIGPTIAGIPAVLVGFFISPLVGLATIAWCFLVQQIENNFLVPRVMNQQVGVNPVITLLSLAVGAKMAGVAGAIVAIPIYLTIKTLLEELAFNQEKK